MKQYILLILAIPGMFMLAKLIVDMLIRSIYLVMKATGFIKDHPMENS